MSDPRRAVVLAAFDAFRAAVRDKDLASAEALSSPQGWRGRGDGVGRASRRMTRLGVAPGAPEDVRVADDRAVVRADDGLDEPIFALYQRDDAGSWRLCALPRDPALSGLFLTGQLEALPTLDALSDSDAAAAWARDLIAAGSAWRFDGASANQEAAAAADKLRALVGERGVRVERVATVTLPYGERCAVGLRFTRRGSPARDEVWPVLVRDARSRRLALHHLAWTPTVSALLEGVDLPWTGDLADRPVVELPSESTEVSGTGHAGPDLVRRLEAAIARLAAAGADADALALAEDVRHRFAVGLEQDAGPRASSRPGPVVVDVAGALKAYVTSSASPASTGAAPEVTVDRAFVADHGKGLLRAMVGAFASALAPERSVVAAGDRVEVDVVDLFGALLPGVRSTEIPDE